MVQVKTQLLSVPKELLRQTQDGILITESDKLYNTILGVQSYTDIIRRLIIFICKHYLLCYIRGEVTINASLAAECA